VTRKNKPKLNPSCKFKKKKGESTNECAVRGNLLLSQKMSLQ